VKIFGFIGPNGAGKTATLRIMSTLILPTSGTEKILTGKLKLKGLTGRKKYRTEEPYPLPKPSWI
jgi:ABC-type multidrug transport system ATPase subunit